MRYRPLLPQRALSIILHAKRYFLSSVECSLTAAVGRQRISTV